MARGTNAVIARSLLLFLCAASMVAQIRKLNDPVRLPQDDVTSFQVIDRDGATLKYRLISLKDRSNKEYIRQCQSSDCRHLPRGTYRYVLQEPESRDTIEGDAYVSAPGSLVTAVHSPPVTWSGNTLRGRVDGLRKGMRPWIRIQSIFTNAVYDCQISAEGLFAVRGILSGKYMAYLILDGKVVNLKPFDCCSGALTMRIGEGLPMRIGEQ